MSETPDYVKACLRNARADEAKKHKLNPTEWATLVKGMGRTPSLLELGVVSALWSEHCSYKSSKRLLGVLPTSGKRVLQGPGENAGVVDIGGGWAVAFKMESHNHPSFIEPYQGAATGVGGIMRDVFTMGARPIASLNALRFGEPYDNKMSAKTRSLVHGVVAGIGGYGNCMGVPTVGGETWFHKSYNRNNLVNAFNIGLLRADRIFRGAASGVGNPVLYVGSKTGRDGIHGASMSSDSFSSKGADQRPTVQAGDPFQEKKLLEACMELMARDCIIGIQDMGAAGLTSSSFEMASRAGSGVRLDLSRVPTREPNMSPYELMLSESQERMLMVLREGTESVAHEIFARWELDAVVIGEVIAGDSVELCWGDALLSRINVELTQSGFPLPERTRGQWPKFKNPRDVRIAAVKDSEWGSFLVGWMGHPNQASKAWIYGQYDSTVQGATVRGPGAEAAVVAPPEIAPRALALTADCPSRYVAVSPYEGGRHAVASALRNLACVGSEGIGLTDCLNVGNPEKPEVYESMAAAIEGLAEACRATGVPVVSGNVSLYNETDGTGVYPTPEIGVVGLIPTVREAPRPLRVGDNLLIIGKHKPVWGGAQYALDQCGERLGPLPELDWTRENVLREFVIEVVRAGLVLDAKDVGAGGLLTSTLQLLFRHGKLGMRVTAKFPAWVASDPTQFWLGETAHCYVLAIESAHLAAVRELLRSKGIPNAVLGQVTVDSLELATTRALRVAPVYDAWRNGLASWVHNRA